MHIAHDLSCTLLSRHELDLASSKVQHQLGIFSHSLSLTRKRNSSKRRDSSCSSSTCGTCTPVRGWIPSKRNSCAARGLGGRSWTSGLTWRTSSMNSLQDLRYGHFTTLVFLSGPELWWRTADSFIRTATFVHDGGTPKPGAVAASSRHHQRVRACQPDLWSNTQARPATGVRPFEPSCCEWRVRLPATSRVWKIGWDAEFSHAKHEVQLHTPLRWTNKDEIPDVLNWSCFSFMRRRTELMAWSDPMPRRRLRADPLCRLRHETGGRTPQFFVVPTLKENWTPGKIIHQPCHFHQWVPQYCHFQELKTSQENPDHPPKKGSTPWPRPAEEESNPSTPDRRQLHTHRHRLLAGLSRLRGAFSHGSQPQERKLSHQTGVRWLWFKRHRARKDAVVQPSRVH